MEAKYTKGPWKVCKQFSHQGFIEVEHCDRHTKGAASLVVARVTCRESWRVEQEANARLISAAPDLLEALQEAMQALEWCVEQGGGPVCEHESGVVCFCKENNAISAARAAIAKALGK